MQNKNAISFWYKSRFRCEDEILTAKLKISRPIFSRNDGDERLGRRVRLDELTGAVELSPKLGLSYEGFTRIEL